MSDQQHDACLRNIEAEVAKARQALADGRGTDASRHIQRARTILDLLTAERSASAALRVLPKRARFIDRAEATLRHSTITSKLAAVSPYPIWKS